jgi:hypothetical protein
MKSKSAEIAKRALDDAQGKAFPVPKHDALKQYRG